MAIYGVDFYGTAYYGTLPYVEFNASPFTADPYDYGVLQLRWGTPSGDWDQIRLVRNSYGAPDFESDGAVLGLAPDAVGVNEWFDRDLREGNFYYYALFVRTADTQQWVRAGVTIGLVTQNFGYGTQMFEWLPGWFQEQDDARPRAPFFQGPLRRYLNVVGLAADFTRTELETLRWLRRPERISGDLLPLMAQQYGVPVEPAIGMRRTRFWLRDAMFLYKRKGTLPGIQDIVTTITGWDSVVGYGPNILRGICTDAWFHDADSTVADLFDDSNLVTGDIRVEITTAEAEWEISNAPLPVTNVRYHGIAIEAETAYTFSTEFLATAGAGDVEVEIAWHDEDGDLLSTETSSPWAVAADGNWQLATVDAVSPVGAVYAVVRARGDLDVEMRFGQLTKGTWVEWTAPMMLDIALLPTRTNYVTNPSFEFGLATWTTDAGDIERSEALALNGNASLRVVSAGQIPVVDGGDPENTPTDSYDGGSPDDVPSDQLSGGPPSGPAELNGTGFSILTGGPYPIELLEVRHSLRVYVSNSGSRARVRWLNDAQGLVSASNWADAVPEPGNTWFTISLSSFSPAGATQAVIDVEVSEDTYLDSVLLEAADTPGGYFDGSTFGADYVWGANAHASTSRFYPQRSARNSRLLAILPEYLPVNQIFQLRYVEADLGPMGLETTDGTLGIDTLGIATLGTSE